MPDNNGAVDLGTPKAEEQQQEPTTQNALYAFAVIADMEGNVGVYNYESEDIEPLITDLNNDLVYGACANVLKDIVAKTSGEATLSMQMMQARAMSEQMEQQRVAEMLKQGGGVRG